MASKEPAFHYEISMRRPHRHLFHVEFTASGTLADSVEVKLPVWTPGSYLIREYSRNLQDVRVRTTQGDEAEVAKINKNTWRLTGVADGFVMSFGVYAFDLSVQTPHLDETHGFIHPIGTCPYVDGYLESPYEVTIVPEPGWRVATGLTAIDEAEHRYRAKDYDELADCPIECGEFAEASFSVKRRKHRIVVSGTGDVDLRRLARDTKRIVEEQLAFWGELPYKDYTFICHVYPNARGGLEHRNSTVLGIDSFAFHPRKRYESDVLTLVAHEFFHTWNVKRIRPRVLGPFDYSQENYTRLLWVFEGVTSYYDGLLTTRAGLMSPKRYLKTVAERIAKLESQPGRRRQSLADSSFDTWIKLYRPNEHTPNSSISYYLKGELVGMLLDLHIRDRTDGRVALDDVMRAMWIRYKDDDRGIEEDEFERIAEEVSGLKLAKFFRKAVHSTDELDFGAALKPFGLKLTRRRKGESGDEPEGPTPWLGLETIPKNGMLAIKHVIEESAADAAGLSAGDLIVAFDRLRVAPDKFRERLNALKPGREVEVTIFRRDRLDSVVLEIPKKFEFEYVISEVDDSDERALELRRGWLGAELNGKGKQEDDA